MLFQTTSAHGTMAKARPVGSLWAIAFLAIVAGCDGDPLGAHDDPPPGHEPVWSAPAEFGHADPRLARGDRLYRVYRASPGGPIQLQASADEGDTWTTARSTGISRAIPLYGAFRAQGPILHLLTEDGAQNLYYHRSPDGGASWDTAIRLNQDPQQRAHRVWMEVRGDYVHVLNTRPFNATNHQTTYWRSTDGGRSFGPPVVMADPSVRSSGGGLAVAGDDVFAVYEWRVWDEERQFWAPGGIYFQRSADNGATWSAREVVHPGPAHRPRVFAGEGRVLVTWATWTGAGAGLMPMEYAEVRTSSDLGETFGAPTIALFEPGSDLGHPAWALEPGGRVHVIAYDSNDPAGALMYAYSLDYGRSWSASQPAGDAFHTYEMVVSDRFLHAVVGNSPVYYIRRPLGP